MTVKKIKNKILVFIKLADDRSSPGTSEFWKFDS